jgi:hypothetical protein
MKKKPKKSSDTDEKKESSDAYKKWKDEEKNRSGNDVASEIKIANAGGALEGGENKQWHMDQGDFDAQEKKDFENKKEKE